MAKDRSMGDRVLVAAAAAGAVLLLSLPGADAADLVLSLYDLTGTAASATSAPYSFTPGSSTSGWDVFPPVAPVAGDPLTLSDFEVNVTTMGSAVGNSSGNWFIHLQVSITNKAATAQDFKAVLTASGLGASGFNGARAGIGGLASGPGTAVHNFTESVSGNSHTFAPLSGTDYHANNTRYLGGGTGDLTLVNQVISTGIGAGETISFDTELELVALATGDATNVNLGAIHVNGDFAAKTSTITNTASGTGQSVTAVVTPAANVTLDGLGTAASITNPIAEGASRTLNVDYTATSVIGPVNQTANAQFTSVGSNGTVQTNSDIITIAGMIYSGQSNWIKTSGGSWGGGDPQLLSTHDEWGTNEGAPGVWLGAANGNFDNVDTATFGNAITSPTATVTVDSVVSVRSITFNNTENESYTIAPGSGTLALKSISGTANLDDLAGSHTITAPITMRSDVSSTVSTGSVLTVTQLLADTSGTHVPELTKSGGGTLYLTGTGASSSSAAMTTVYQGTLRVDGTLNSPTLVTKDSGGAGTLSGVNGTIGGRVEVANGGTISPGNGDVTRSSKLTVNSLLLDSGGNYHFDISTMTEPTVANKGYQPSAGTNYDTISSAGQLDLSGITTSDFILQVDYPSGGFTYTKDYHWELGAFTQGIVLPQNITDVDSLFTIDLTLFNAYHHGFWSVSYGNGGSSNLYLNYVYNAVPEAGTAMLGVIGLMPLLAHRRRRTVTETPGIA